jgi:2',5'-phosphodiesterase
VVTFNVLADKYASTDYAKKVMYSYVKNKKHLEIEYRASLFLHELVQYKSDVSCIQECDQRVFESYLEPSLSSVGYKCFFQSKFGDAGEGVATFIHESSLTPVRVLNIRLRDILMTEEKLRPLLDHREDIADLFGSHLNTVVQISLCQSKHEDDQFVLIANTHLFYHPKAAYVRLIQTFCILSLVQKIKTLLLSGEDEIDFELLYTDTCIEREVVLPLRMVPSQHPTKVGVIFAGDLNSTPETAVVEYILR